MPKQPNFWGKQGLLPIILSPFALLYGLGAKLDRVSAKPQRISVPVISTVEDPMSACVPKAMLLDAAAEY